MKLEDPRSQPLTFWLLSETLGKGPERLVELRTLRQFAP